MISEPKNGTDVLILFSKFHEQLGFNKIFRSSYLKVQAEREGQPVTIQFVHKLNQFLNSYHVEFCLGYMNGWRWRKEADVWRPYHPKKGWGDERCNYFDPDSLLTTNHDGTALVYKTLSDEFDIVICWIKNCELDDDIEVLELQPLFKTQKGIIEKKATMKRKYLNSKHMRTPDKLLLALMKNGPLAKPEFFRVVDAKPAYIKLGFRTLLRKGMIHIHSEAQNYVVYALTEKGRAYAFNKWFHRL